MKRDNIFPLIWIWCILWFTYYGIYPTIYSWYPMLIMGLFAIFFGLTMKKEYFVFYGVNEK